MATLAELEAQLAALESARGRGVLRVSSASGTVEYRSMDDILKAIAAVQSAIDALTDATPPRRVKIHADKDL